MFPHALSVCTISHLQVRVEFDNDGKKQKNTSFLLILFSMNCVNLLFSPVPWYLPHPSSVKAKLKPPVFERIANIALCIASAFSDTLSLLVYQVRWSSARAEKALSRDCCLGSEESMSAWYYHFHLWQFRSYLSEVLFKSVDDDIGISDLTTIQLYERNLSFRWHLLELIIDVLEKLNLVVNQQD